MTKVMVFGTFDGLHLGHLNFLKQAKKYGDYLIVIVARDKNTKKEKGYPPLWKEKERLKEIRKISLVDKAILGRLKNKFQIILTYKPKIICLGYDQKIKIHFLKRVLQNNGLNNIQIIRLKAYQPSQYKSSILCQNYQK